MDEMDLVSQALDVAPLAPEAYERARTRLREAMAESGPAPEVAPVPDMAPGKGFSLMGNRRRRPLGTAGKVGIGAGIGLVAAGVAVALVATSTPQPAAPAGPSASRGSAGSATHASTVNAKLMSLVSRIKANHVPLSGNAWLTIRTQAIGDKTPEVLYEVHTDSGAIYATYSESSLRAAIAHGDNLADGTEARQLAVARYAATGDLTTARLKMINLTQNYLGLGMSPAAQQKEWARGMAAEREVFKEKGVKAQPKPWTSKSVQGEADNFLWTNSVEALDEGEGNPQVREGVLRLISTISGVTVGNSTTDGQPTLTLTAGPEVFGGAGSEVLTVDAKTGMPVKDVNTTPGVPTSVQTYQNSRVTLADIEAGKP
ncbi:MAG: hypothetical protein ACRDNW_06110 [Trebonia sp.]